MHRYRPYFVNLSVFLLQIDESYRFAIHEGMLHFFPGFSLSGKILHFLLLRKHIRKNVRCFPEKNFVQGFKLCMVLILIQHDQKIRKPAKTLYVCIFTGLLSSAQLIRHNYIQSVKAQSNIKGPWG